MKNHALDTASASTAAPDTHPRQLTLINGGDLPRLVIADDEPVVRASLTAQLGHLFNIVGTAKDAESVVDLVRRERPDAAIVDVEMPGGGGLHTTRGIRDASPETAVIILSIDETDNSVVEFMKAGAMMYLRKGTPAELIAQRIHQSIAAHKQLGHLSHTTDAS